MNEIIGYVISGAIGIALTKLYDKFVKEYNNKKRNIEREKIKSKDIFAEYVKYKKVEPIVSYGDNHAIEIEPIMQYGKPLLKAHIDLTNIPKTDENRKFVMVALIYLPDEDWKYYSEKHFSLKFKIRGSINAVQLEVKDPQRNKLIDEFVEVEKNFREYAFTLWSERNWEKVNQICFTVFCESEYISECKGSFEVIDCYLDQ